MAILELTTNEKSVCAIPDPGIDAESAWESDSNLFRIEEIAEDTRSATVVATDGTKGGVGFLVVTTEDETVTVISTLEVRVSGDKVRFFEVSASTPDQKQTETRDREPDRKA